MKTKKNGWRKKGEHLAFLLTFVMLFAASESLGEDIVLTGNQAMVIENTTYTQTGNIFVRDNAKLILKNATLIWNTRYHSEFKIEISGNSSLEIINSTVEVPLEEAIDFIFLDEVNVTVQDSDLGTKARGYFDFGHVGSVGYDGPLPTFRGNASISNTKLHSIGISLTPQGGGTISVSNTESVHLALRFRNNFRGNFSDLKPGLFKYWSYYGQGHNITLKDTSFSVIVIACDGSSEVTIRNSEIFQFASHSLFPTIKMKAIDSIIHSMCLIGQEGITVQFWGLKPGLYSNWKLSDHAIGDTLPEIILENTEIKEPFTVYAFGANLSIDDSILYLRAYWPSNNYTITNSEVQELMLYCSTDTILNFDNTIIHRLNVYVPPNSVVIKGNITFPDEAEITNWFSPSVITREYPVILTHQSGNIISGATLNLYSKDGALIWCGATDENGKAKFHLEFNDSNYSDSWKLEIGYLGKKYFKNISLLTSTPIQLLWAPNVFSDVPFDYWAEDYITAIYNPGITTGCAQDDPNTPENERGYCPEDSVTREQMAAFIVRAVEGEPAANYCDSGTPFPDVTSDMWSCRYIKRLKELGITTGYQDGTYGPYDNVPREQMAAFIVRAKEGEPAANYCASGSPFSDVDPNHWACKYIKRLHELGITTGCGQNPLRYCPNDIVTRAQMAVFLARAFLGME